MKVLTKIERRGCTCASGTQVHKAESFFFLNSHWRQENVSQNTTVCGKSTLKDEESVNLNSCCCCSCTHAGGEQRLKQFSPSCFPVVTLGVPYFKWGALVFIPRLFLSLTWNALAVRKFFKSSRGFLTFLHSSCCYSTDSPALPPQTRSVFSSCSSLKSSFLWVKLFRLHKASRTQPPIEGATRSRVKP